MNVTKNLQPQSTENATNTRIYRYGSFRGAWRSHLGIILLGTVLLAVASSASDYYRSLILLTCLWAFWAVAWNLLGGFAGQVSIGHTLFVGLAAYGTAVVFVNRGISAWYAIPCAVVVGALLGYLMGLMLFRKGLEGLFFALATFALGEVALYTVLNIDSLGGGQGLMVARAEGIAELQFFDRMPYVLWSVILMVVGVVIAASVHRSRFGRRLVSIREDQDAASALGVNVQRIKSLCFALSGALTAMGGVLYVQYVLYVEPQSVLGPIPAVQIVLFALLGGRKTVWGPVLGALLLYPLASQLRLHTSGIMAGSDLLLYGLLLAILVPLLPDGLTSLGPRLRRTPKGHESADSVTKRSVADDGEQQKA